MLAYKVFNVAPEFADELNVVLKCPQCFPMGTLVRAERGYVPIEEISVGERVLSASGIFSPVAKTFKTHVRGELVALKTPLTPMPLRVTPEHPILALRSKARGAHDCRPGTCDQHSSIESDHELVWVRAGDLVERDYVATMIFDDSKNVESVSLPIEFRGRYHSGNKCVRNRKGPSEFELTPDFLWAIGLYLAEGSAGKRDIVYSLHADETEYRSRLQEVFEGLGFKTREIVSGNNGDLAVTGASLADWFPSWLGSGCANKQIPNDLMNLPDDRILHVREGILDGDGCERFDDFGQTSRILAQQVAEIGLRTSSPNRMPSIRTNQRPDRLRQYQVCNARGDGVSDRRAPAEGEKFHHRFSRNTWRIDGRPLYRITQKINEFFDGFVYNLQIQGDPTYIVDGIAVHNCHHIFSPGLSASEMRMILHGS